jgi:hypothetical protein
MLCAWAVFWLIGGGAVKKNQMCKMAICCDWGAMAVVWFKTLQRFAAIAAPNIAL